MAERTIARALTLLGITLLVVSCASSDYDQPSPRSGPAPRGEDSGRVGVRAGAASGLDMLPPQDWWYDDTIATAVNLSPDQLKALDRIGRDQGDPIDRLDRDLAVAVRDLRQQFDLDKPATNDIVAAGQRLRAMRDEIFDRQVKMLADERQVLTQAQWRTLQDQLQARRRSRDQNDGGNRRGRGGFPGRRPGRPF